MTIHVDSSTPTTAPTHPTATPINKPAIVLSGGGALGDFEVGAVRCLYNRGVRPSILCGTSVGSINALKLAEGEDSPFPSAAPVGHSRGLAGLEKIWLGLSSDSDMWDLEPGVADVFKTLNDLPAELSDIAGQADAVGKASIFGVIGSILGIPGVLSFAPQLSDLNRLSGSVSDLIHTICGSLNDAMDIQGFANYDPLERIMRNPTSFFPAGQQSSGITLRLAMVALEDGALRYATETNVLVERSGHITKVTPPPTAAEIAALKTQRDALINEISLLEGSQPGQGGNQGPYQKPKPGIAEKRAELAQVKAKLARMLMPRDLIRAAIASSSLPVVCRPTPMWDGYTYIDGGIRTLAPVEAAIEVGATKVFAIAAGSPQMEVKSLADIGSNTPLPLLGIALRVGEEILPNEVGHRDLYPSNRWPVPVIVIQPNIDVDVHDGMTIEPGLIRIRMAYGFMRAYDTVRAYDKWPGAYLSLAQQNSANGMTNEIIKKRREIWDAEFPANGKKFVLPGSSLPPSPYTVQNLSAPDKNALDNVRKLKLELKQLLEKRVAFYADAQNNIKGEESLPADFGTWSTHWEKHNWTPTATL